MLINYLKNSSQYLKAKCSQFKENGGDYAFAFALAVLVMAAPDIASAGNANVSIVSGTICNIVNTLQGPIARGVAAFAVIFLGFSLFLGKISWGVALALGIGLAAIFGAEQIVNAMSAGSGSNGQTCSV